MLGISRLGDNGRTLLMGGFIPNRQRLGRPQGTCPAAQPDLARALVAQVEPVPLPAQLVARQHPSAGIRNLRQFPGAHGARGVFLHRYATAQKFPGRLGVGPAQADADDLVVRVLHRRFRMVIGRAVGDGEANLPLVIILLRPALHGSAGHFLPDVDIRQNGVIGNALHPVGKYPRLSGSVLLIAPDGLHRSGEFLLGKRMQGNFLHLPAHHEIRFVQPRGVGRLRLCAVFRRRGGWLLPAGGQTKRQRAYQQPRHSDQSLFHWMISPFYTEQI